MKIPPINENGGRTTALYSLMSGQPLPILYPDTYGMELNVETILEDFVLTYEQTEHGRARHGQFLGVFFNYWFKLPEKKMEKIITIVQDFYKSAILEDDICDKSLMRGGIPTLYLIYGVSSTTNYAAYALTKTIKGIMDLDPNSIEESIGLLMKMYEANNMDIYWRNNFICPTEDEYLNVIVIKSTAFFRFLMSLLKRFSASAVDLEKLVTIMGPLIQIWNDYNNVASDKTALLKTYADDVTEGKFSFPIIHAIRSRPDDDQILNILKQRTTNYEMKKYFVSLLTKYGSLEYTLKYMNKLKEELIEELERLDGNPDQTHALEIMFKTFEAVG